MPRPTGSMGACQSVERHTRLERMTTVTCLRVECVSLVMSVCSPLRPSALASFPARPPCRTAWWLRGIAE